jgi:peptidoglycan/LPS O-acetylase OafA/YrhL
VRHGDPRWTCALFRAKKQGDLGNKLVHLVHYRPEIDGLRAIAVGSVILFHAGLRGVPGGYLGVDIFFVISGYLITSIISAEMEAGTFSFVAFYDRRARRILPPLFLVVLTCVPFALLAMLPRDILEFSKSVLAVSAFVSNIFFWKQSGYFYTQADLKPLLHTWSLGVEEQFYLGFPVLLMLSLRLGRKGASAVFLASAIASIAYAQWACYHDKEAAFFLIPGRIWELLMGALVPLALPEIRQRLPLWARELLGVLGLGLIAYAVCGNDELSYPGIYSLPPAGGALLIVLFAGRETIVGRLLGSRVPVAIGLVSYSAYLWHQPVFAFARLIQFHESDTFVFLALSALSIALAALTYKLVERPVRDRKKFGRSGVFLLSLAGTACLASIGLAGILTGGFESEYRNLSDFDTQRTYELIKRNTGGDLRDDMGTNNDCVFWAPKIDATTQNRFVSCVKKYGPATVVLGDSHGMNIYNALFRANYGKFVVGLVNPGCRPWDKSEGCPYAGFDDFLTKNKTSVETVILHFSGSHLILDEAGREEPAALFEYGWKYRISDKMIANTIDYLEEMSALTRVMWLGPFIEARVDFRNIKKLAQTGFRLNSVSMDIFAALENAIRQHIEHRHTHFRYIPFSEIVKSDREFLLVGDCLTYRDLDHFSVCGEQIIGEQLKSKLSSYSAGR